MTKLKCALLTVLLLLPSMAFAQMPERITLSTQNHCPYGCFDENGVYDGPFYRIAKHALDKMGIALDLKIAPWPRAQLMAELDETDGFFAASKNDKRDERSVMASVTLNQSWTWFFIKGTETDPTTEQFKTNSIITCRRGTNVARWLSLNGYKTYEARTYPDVLKVLNGERVTAAMTGDWSMNELIKEQNFEDRISRQVQEVRPLGFYFSKRFLKKYPEFLDRFNTYAQEYLDTH